MITPRGECLGYTPRHKGSDTDICPVDGIRNNTTTGSFYNIYKFIMGFVKEKKRISFATSVYHVSQLPDMMVPK